MEAFIPLVKVASLSKYFPSMVRVDESEAREGISESRGNFESWTIGRMFLLIYWFAKVAGGEWVMCSPGSIWKYVKDFYFGFRHDWLRGNAMYIHQGELGTLNTLPYKV